MESITLSNELPESYLNEGMLFCEMGVKCGSLNSGNLILEYIGLLMGSWYHIQPSATSLGG